MGRWPDDPIWFPVAPPAAALPPAAMKGGLWSRWRQDCPAWTHLSAIGILWIDYGVE